MSTPGRARALRALGAKKRANVRRVAKGLKPIVAGKKVSAKSLGLTKAKAQRRVKHNNWKTMPKTYAGRSAFKGARGRHKK